VPAVNKSPGDLDVSALFQGQLEALIQESRGQWERRLEESLAVLTGAGHAQASEEARATAATCLRKLHRHNDAIAVLSAGTGPGASAGLYHRLIALLVECNRTADAIRVAREAMSLFPEDILSRLKYALVLPVVYASTGEIAEYRIRYSDGLSWLRDEILLDTVERCRAAATALSGHVNTYLAYQGLNDIDLQLRYGSLAHRIMAACYPQWTRPLGMPSRSAGEPLRLGYVSSRFLELSATRFFLGWIRHHNRSRVTVSSWYVRPKIDTVTQEVCRLSASFHHFPDATDREVLEKTAASIRAQDLHALIFLDIGLDPLMTQLAALRLAPIQCMAWDHTVTSGLATVDYALTGALTEPEAGDAHYSERLVRLPGVGVCYEKPAIPDLLLRKSRAAFQLKDSSVVYLCCQSLFKFLPENDDVFVRIAAQVPAAEFVFIETNELAGKALRGRLHRAFSRRGLNAADHCVLLPELSHLDYWNLHLIADVFLDTIGWSSGGSIFEAVACRVPVVTLPGPSMRSRQGASILTQLGAPGTIAGDKTAYVELAVRIARDKAFREAVVQQMIKGASRLYSDRRSVGALEDFLENAVDERLAMEGSARVSDDAAHIVD